MRRVAWPLALVVALILLPVCASAASFTIDDYQMDIRVQTDGSGSFVETITYAFQGKYNGMTATVRRPNGGQIRDMRVYVDGYIELARVDTMRKDPFTYVAEDDGEAISLQAYAPGKDGTRMFRIEYRIDGYAERYRDTARVRRDLLIAETGYPRATFRVTLPGSDGREIQSFVRGVPDGCVESLESGVWTVGPTAVSKGSTTSVNLLFPSRWLPDAPLLDEDILEATLAEEQAIADEIARAAEAQAATERTMRIVLPLALVVYAAGFAVLFWRQRGKYGLRHQVRPVWDEVLLAQTPAVVAEWLRDNRVSSAGLCAGLLELAEKGLLSVTAEGANLEMSRHGGVLEEAAAESANSEILRHKGISEEIPTAGGSDMVFTRTAAKPAGLRPHQEQLLRWFFVVEGDALSIADLDVGDDIAAARAFNARYGAWKEMVKDDAVREGLAYRSDTARLLGGIGAATVGFALSMALFAYQLLPLGILGLLLSAALCCAFVLLRRLTDDGERRLAAIHGFLQSYGDRLQTDSRSIYTRTPLVMALGLTQPLADWIDRHPDAATLDDDAMQMSTWWMMPGWHHALVRMDKAARDAQGHNAAAHDPNQGGDSGGSGGISGGGGSSHGAW